MGDGHADPAIQQAEPVRRERDRIREAVGAVAGQQHGGATVALGGGAAHQRDRDPGPVLRDRVHALGSVAGGVVAAPHFRLLAQQQASARDVVVEDRGRRDQRLVAQAVGVGLELGVGVGAEVVGRLGELHVVMGPARHVGDAQADQPLLALVDHVVPGEDLDVLQHHVVAVGQDLAPARGRRIAHRGGHQPEVAPAASVGADVEHVAVRPPSVLHLVLVVLLAGRDETPRAVRIGGRAHARLGAGEAARGQEEEGEAPRAGHVDTEERVHLLEEQIGRRGAQAVPVEPVRPLGLVFGDVEEGPAVGGPRHRAHLVDPIRQQGAGVQVLDVERVLPEAGDVGGVGEAPAVVAHRRRADREERMADRERVQIEDHLLGRVETARLAAVDRVLLAGLGARVVEEAALPIGNGLIVLLDARQHLRVEALLERRRGGHDQVGVRVLRGEVLGDRGVVPIAHPEVVVDPDVAMDDVGPGHPLGDGGHGGHATHRTTGAALARAAGRSLHWLPRCRSFRT